MTSPETHYPGAPVRELPSTSTRRLVIGNGELTAAPMDNWEPLPNPPRGASRRAQVEQAWFLSSVQ